MGEAQLKRLTEAAEKLPEPRLESAIKLVENMVRNQPLDAIQSAGSYSLPRTRPLSDWHDMIGIMSHEEGEELQRVIDEGCRQVDPREW